MTQFPLNSNLRLLPRLWKHSIESPIIRKNQTLTTPPTYTHLSSSFALKYMDQWKPKLEFHQHQHQLQHQHQYIPNDQREINEMEGKDTSDARKVQKADREKLRRDRLNEQFIELGNLLDPDRPKNDKASIIIDTIQVLKDLTTEVNRLKAECAVLLEESCELTQEKNELREEKSSLKTDLENLNSQYQQRVGVMFPWGAIDPSSVVMPPPYPFPVGLPVPAGPVQVHPFPFFTNHNPPGAFPTSSPAYRPYPNQTIPVYAHTSYSCLSKQERGSKSSDRFRGSNVEKGDTFSDVVTELELQTPGSRSGQESSVGDKKGKQPEGGCSSTKQTSSNSVVENSGGD